MQRDYDQVHEQLAVAIKERDTAIEQFKEKANEIATMIRNRYLVCLRQPVSYSPLSRLAREQSEKVVEYELEGVGVRDSLHDDSLSDGKVTFPSSYHMYVKEALEGTGT